MVTVEPCCVAKNNAEDSALQSGGADCGPIQPGGLCYDSSDIIQTATFAFNDYYLKHGLTVDSCYFNNNAALTSLDPCHGIVHSHQALQGVMEVFQGHLHQWGWELNRLI